MAKAKKEETEESKDKSILFLTKYLKDNKADHLNFEEQVDWVVSTSSLKLDIELGGGFRPGAIKVAGASFAGKSSCVAQCTKNFLKTVPNSKAIWIKAEGRLSDGFRARSGVNYVYSAEEWENGTCFVFECNVFETVTDLINGLVRNNPDKVRYLICIDSMDNLIRRDDIAKESADSEKVGAAGLLTSTMFKKANLVLNKMGHALFMICQVRAKIEVNQYAPKDKNQSVGGGGANAVTHNANQVWDFQSRTKGRNIEEGGEVVGHYAAIKFTKGVKERIDIVVEYPIKHGQTNGESVWLEYEIADILLSFGLVKKKEKSSWLVFPETFIKELNENGFSVEPEFSVQGEGQLKNWLSENPDIAQYLYKKFISLLSK